MTPPSDPAQLTLFRRRSVHEAEHSGEMEGLHVDSETSSDAVDYVAGRIDSDELVARARARYGLA